MNTALSVTFEGAYRLDEYLSVLSEFAPVYKKAKARKKSNGTARTAEVKWYDRITIAIVGRLAFYYKANKVGTCVFEIDEHQIQRTSKLGVHRIPWRDVIAIHRFSQAYLIEKDKGAMPLPYRCLSASEAADLDKIIRSKEAELERAT